MPTGAASKERAACHLRASGAPHRCTGSPRLPLSVSGLHPSSNLCICCQLQLCPRHVLSVLLTLTLTALLHSSGDCMGVGTNNSPIFQGGN